MVILAGAGAVWTALRDRGDREEAEAVATAYLAAWERRDWAALSQVVAEPPPDLGERQEGVLTELGVDRARFARGSVTLDGASARAQFSARLHLSGLGEWRYLGELELVRRDGDWLVDWSPAAIHPALAGGWSLRRSRAWPARAPILAEDGTPLSAQRPVIVVGVEPRRIRNRKALFAALARFAGADPDEVRAELARPEVEPDWFVPVAELRPQHYERVRPRLYPVPGTVFRRAQARLAPTDEFGFHVLGRVGEVTAERLEQLGDPYAVGDSVGLFGLEETFERRLAGRPSGQVAVVHADGKRVRVLRRFRGSRPRPLRTTLDADLQAAAEKALAAVKRPAALVALDAASGKIRAVASRPLDGFERALAARYPPGSTFKIVTTTALLENGLSPGATVSCPDEVFVGGKPFRNAEGAALGSIPFSEAFAQSCNTAFVQLAAKLSDADLSEAAEKFGFGAAYELPLPVAGGRFPDPRDEAERAAQAIGQGRVEVSPLHLATVAAAAASGTWQPPRLLAGQQRDSARRLDTATARTLRRLMRLVVTAGTGRAAAVAGQDVAGKTGTAEFGTRQPPRTHAWFAGFRGRLAFAIFVEGGGAGSKTAAPLAARLVASLPD